METNNNDLIHYTYNPVKKDFLKNKGVSYLVEGTHKITGKSFWTYLKCDKLNNALIDWRKYQKERFNE